MVVDRTNLRYLRLPDLPGQAQPVDLISLDLSFISVLKVMEAVSDILRPGGFLIVLIKPQFEAGRNKVSYFCSKIRCLPPMEAKLQAAEIIDFVLANLCSCCNSLSRCQACKVQGLAITKALAQAFIALGCRVCHLCRQYEAACLVLHILAASWRFACQDNQTAEAHISVCQ